MNAADPVNADALDGFADEVAKRVTSGGTYHVARLLPGGYPKEPERPDVWKDEAALNEWKRGLPDRDTVIVLRVVESDPAPFENETRCPEAIGTDQ